MISLHHKCPHAGSAATDRVRQIIFDEFGARQPGEEEDRQRFYLIVVADAYPDLNNPAHIAKRVAAYRRTKAMGQPPLAHEQVRLAQTAAMFGVRQQLLEAADEYGLDLARVRSRPRASADVKTVPAASPTQLPLANHSSVRRRLWLLLPLVFVLPPP